MFLFGNLNILASEYANCLVYIYIYIHIYTFIYIKTGTVKCYFNTQRKNKRNVKIA